MIKLENIHRNFQVGDQTVHALDDINLEIHDGEYVSIMGPSGSGKSTLLNLLGLLDPPSSGEYFLNNTNITDLDENQLAKTRNQNIGFVFQTFHLISRLTAAENIELPLVLAGIDESIRKQRVNKALESMTLLDRASHNPNNSLADNVSVLQLPEPPLLNPQYYLPMSLPEILIKNQD